MRISTRGEYGVRAMLELALHYGEGPIPLKTISKRQNISENYLEQLMGPLRRAGLVRSVRGAQGGYALATTPEETCVGDIIRTLEGPIAPMECVDREDTCCSEFARCATRVLWERLRDSMEQVLYTTSLGDLCQEANKLKHIEGIH